MVELHSPQLFSEKHYYTRSSRLDLQTLLDIDQALETWLDQDSGRLERTHYFHGRHENLYLRQTPPLALQTLLDEAQGYAAELIGIEAGLLRAGWWFNRMEPGDITTLHRHDDGFELLSGVVYLRVPDGSGELVLEPPGEEPIPIPPRAGEYRFFDPTLPHRVTRNESGQRRLSIGMNFGRVDELS